MLFKDLLERNSREQLLAFCHNSGLNSLDDLTKEDIITTLVTTILSEAGLKELLFTLSKQGYELLEEVSKHKTHYNKQNYVAFFNCERSLLMTKDKDTSQILCPDDLLALFNKINNREFKNEYKVKHHMVSIIKFADAFYGYYKVSDLNNLFKLNNYAYSSPLGQAYFKSMIGDASEDDIFTNLSEEKVDELAAIQADKPYYIPTLNELEEYFSYGYIETAELKKFLDTLEKKFNNYEGRYFIAHQLQSYLNAKNSKPTSFWRGLLEKINNISEDEVRYLTLLFVESVNSMHVIANRGFSPNALKNDKKHDN